MATTIDGFIIQERKACAHGGAAPDRREVCAFRAAHPRLDATLRLARLLH
jgi:hypothetical protein